MWETEFLPLTLKATTTTELKDTFLTDIIGIESFINRDEFDKYIYRNPTIIEDPKSFNLIS